MQKEGYYNLNISKKVINLKSNRNIGIDSLKIFAMINIINLHINLHSFNLSLDPLHPKYKQVYRLEVFSFWPVDAFGLISGMIGYKKYKLANIIYIWFEYFFYSVILSIYAYLKSLINKRDVLYHFFPLGIRRHWYVNAYFFMYLFLPFLNNSINLMNKNSFSKFFFIFLFMYSFYHLIAKAFFNSPNYDFINSGYSSLWLLILYILGSFIGRFYINQCYFPNFYFILIYLLSSLITSESIIYNGNKIFLDYISPTIIIQALSLIFFFSNIKIRNKYLTKIILFLNPLNFNVTLIHTRIFSFKTTARQKFFYYIKSLNPNLLFFKINGISIAVYFVCAFIDYLRLLLFKVMKIRIFSNYLDKKIF